MSLTIIKAGLSDTIQDEGRFGFQAAGINPGGAMDIFSARLANCLLGKPMNAPVIEMHFPAPVISFDEAAIICITGADFTATIGDKEIRVNQPLLINKGNILQFKKVKPGARCYLSALNNFTIAGWLNSYSTNIKAATGGLHGGPLKNGDLIPFEKIGALQTYLKEEPFKILSWYAQPQELTVTNKIEVIKGSEWDWLDETSQQTFLKETFIITNIADRMGYKLSGTSLHVKEHQQLVSSSVSFGTLQLLPSGQLIVLMADHQTTGGYPRVANVISAHLPFLAQSKPGDAFSFAITDVERAEQKLLQQYNYLQLVQHAAGFKIEKILQ
ncbi:MAG: biotin-dependent carboxyltransferase family protein [Segetibacter sp.]|nr:biotin-dependent carboxyltransferase family protein [Segetibacter sp.]